MAFYISIEKVAEDGFVATYCFKSGQTCSGTFEINKESGEVSLLESMPGDDKGHAFNRAAIKIMKEWKQGHLPDLTEWAS